MLSALPSLGLPLADSESGTRITRSFVHSDVLLEHLYMGSPHGLGFFATWCWVLRATVPRECEKIGVPRGRGCCVFFIRSESLSLPLPEGQGNRTCLLK